MDALFTSASHSIWNCTLRCFTCRRKLDRPSANALMARTLAVFSGENPEGTANKGVGASTSGVSLGALCVSGS